MDSTDKEGYSDDSKVGFEKHGVERGLKSIAFRAVDWED
jgi:hypothetical protein